MSEMFNNLNTGDSSASYGSQYQHTTTEKVNGAGTSEYSHSWKRSPRPFGLNVRVPQTPIIGQRTQNLVKKIAAELVMAPIQPIIDYFESNENIFNGSVTAEIESLQKQTQLTVSLLQDADEIVMDDDVPSFMMDM